MKRLLIVAAVLHSTASLAAPAYTDAVLFAADNPRAQVTVQAGTDLKFVRCAPPGKEGNVGNRMGLRVRYAGKDWIASYGAIDPGVDCYAKR